MARRFLQTDIVSSNRRIITKRVGFSCNIYRIVSCWSCHTLLVLHSFRLGISKAETFEYIYVSRRLTTNRMPHVYLKRGWTLLDFVSKQTLEPSMQRRPTLNTHEILPKKASRALHIHARTLRQGTQTVIELHKF